MFFYIFYLPLMPPIRIQFLLILFLNQQGRSISLQLMNPRQRNIPVTTKQQSEVQTDVKLIESYLLDSRVQSREAHHTVTLSQAYSHSGLLRPFSDNQLLKEFSKTLQELKESEENKGAFAKRLEILQQQIQGLLKRDLLLNSVAEGSETWNSYYLTLNEKQKALIRLQNEKIYSDLKIRRLRTRVEELQKEVEELRASVAATQKIGEENKLYASFYERLNTLINTSKRRGADFEALLNEQVVPLVADFNINLTALTRTINRDVHVSIRSSVSALAREFDRLLKEQQFTEGKITENISNLLVAFKAAKGVDRWRQQVDLAARTDQAEANYKNIIALFRHEIENLKQENPNLKTAERIDVLLRRLEGEGVQVVDCKGWMNLVQPEIKVIEINTGDVELKKMVVSLGAEFRRLYLGFPELKTHVTGEVRALLQSEVLVELIEGGSLERLREIIVHQVDTVKVDNVYIYSQKTEKEANFKLRVLIKALLEEFEKARKLYGIEITLDQGILALLKDQIIQGIDIEAVISLFRPPCKYVEVPIVVQKPVYQSRTYERGVPINTEKPVLLQQSKTEVVVVNRQVPVFIDRPVQGTVTSHVPVQVQSQKAVAVEVAREVLVDRVVQSSVQVPVVKEKAVPVYERQEMLVQMPVQRIVQQVEIREVQRVVEAKQDHIVQVQRRVQVPCYIYETRQQLKEVEVRVPHIIRQPQYREVERQVTQIIHQNDIVNIVQQVPVEIRVPEVQLVQLTQVRPKVIITNEVKEVVKEIPVIREKELLKEVPKEVFIERSHFIKGDVVEVLREVQVLVDKPILHEVLTTRDVQIEKVVPLYITQQVPLITEVSVPCFSEKVKQLEVEKVKLVPVREEVVRQVNVDRPVPVVVQKEVVRVEKQIVQKIVEKMVEVPRVVQVEKIVEKIVVVPRIVERVVEVPKIIQKIVVVQVPILQIVEIPVPQIIVQVVEKIVEVIVQKPVIVYEKVFETVEVEKIVQVVVQRERPVEVQVERRIPYEVVRQVPVPTYRDRIEYQRVQVHQTKVEAIEVQVPLIVSEKVPFLQEKTVVTEHIIEKPVVERVTVEKEVAVISEVQKLVVKQIIKEKPVLNEVVVEVPVEKIVYKEVPEVVEVIREKVVELLTIREVPKEIFIENDKLVHQMLERVIEVPVNQIVTTPLLIEVPKLVNLTHYKEIPIEVAVREERVKRDLYEEVKQVQVIREVPVEVETTREKLKQVVKEVKQFITEEVVREIHSQVEVRGPTEYQVVNLPGETVIQTLNSSDKQVQVQEKIIERLVQKIVLLPQIVQVVKNIHHISEVNSLGVAVDVDINVQTEKYLGVTVELRKGLVELLAAFKSNVGRQPDLKALIVLIEKYLKYIDQWIKFPKLVEVVREVVKEVDRDRPVLVPTPDKHKEATLSFILQKLITELRRIRDSHKITLSLDDELLRVLFSERKGEDTLSSKLTIIQEELKKKYSHFGEWDNSSPFLINAFLQDHFALQTLIEEANRQQEAQSQEVESLRKQLEVTSNQYNNLLCFNRKMFEDNNSLIRTLEKYRNSIDEQDFSLSLSTHRKFYEEIIEERHSVIYETIKKSTVIEQRYSREVEHSDRDPQLGQLIAKLTRSESRVQELQLKIKRLELQLSKCEEENKIKSSTIKRLETDFELRISRTKEEISKSPSLSKEIQEENRKSQQKIRALEKELALEKANAEKIRKELQRGSENQKRDYDREIQRREKELRDSTDRTKKESDREINRLKNDVEKIRQEKRKLQLQIVQIKRRSSEEIKNIRELQMSSASDKYNQLIAENVDLRKKNDSLEAEYDKLKKGALENNSANEREIARLRTENEKLAQDKKDYEKSRRKEGFLDLPQETQVINRSIELERKLRAAEAEVDKLKTKDEASIQEIKTLKEKIKKLEIELEIARKEVEASQKSRLQATTYQSGFKPSVSIVENVEGSVVRSPRSPGFKSGSFDRGYLSPQESSLSREERIEELGSSSSRVSQSSEDQGLPPYYSSQMTLREFIDAKHGDEKERDMYVTLVMIKVIEKTEEQAERGIFSSYTPSNIFLSNFNTKHLDRLTVKFGAPITNRNSKTEGIYLAPDVLGGAQPTRKSIVFTLGVILDELIHGSTFFRTVEDILNLQSEFKVRGEKLNPILKNTLFEMMNKEAMKRLDLVEAKRRLSLQKYITSESRSSLTVGARTGARRTTEQ